MSLLLEEIEQRLKDAKYDAGTERYPLTDDAVRVFVKPNCVPVSQSMKNIHTLMPPGLKLKIYAGHNNHVYIEEVFPKHEQYQNMRKLNS